MKTITMTAWKRPDLTQQVLESLIKCCNIKDYKLFAFVEPGCKEVVDVFDTYKKKLNINLYVNAEVLGIAENTKQAFDVAFEHGEYNIHLEDDTVLMPGALKFFEWVNENYKDEESIGTACGYSTNLEISTPQDVILHTWFGCCAWATWRKYWVSMRAVWSDKRKGFARFVGGWQLSNKKLQIYPIQSMCNNIGYANILAVNGKHIKAPKIQLNEEINDDFIVKLHQQIPHINWDNCYLSPSEYILAIDWVHFCMSETKTASFSTDHCINDTPWQLINGECKNGSCVFLWYTQKLPTDIHSITKIIVCAPTPEKYTFLKENNFCLKWKDKDKEGVELWQR
jgi:hypothetical protein